MKRFIPVVALAALLSGCQASNMASLSSVMNSALLGGSGQSNDFGTQQTDVVASLAASLKLLSQSQAIMADALGLKEEAALAENSAKTLENGDFGGSDNMEKVVTTSLAVHKKIQEKIEKGAKLDEESKKKFASALPSYIAGTALMYRTGQKTASTATNLFASKDLTVLVRFADLTYVARNLPDMVTTLTGSTSSIFAYAKSNGIDTAEVEEATEEWS